MWLHMILTSGSSFPSLPVMTLQLCRFFLDLFGPSSIREGFLSSSVQIARLGGEVFGEVDSDFRRFVGTFGVARFARFFGAAGI